MKDKILELLIIEYTLLILKQNMEFKNEEILQRYCSIDEVEKLNKEKRDIK